MLIYSTGMWNIQVKMMFGGGAHLLDGCRFVEEP